MDWDALVVAAGADVEGSGRLVRHGTGTWFQPPGVTPEIADFDPPVQPPGPGAVPVVGADFDAVENRRERNGIVEGYAKVRGRWDSGTLKVDHQVAQQVRVPRHDPRWEIPPCPAPADGWPHTGPGADLDFELGALPSSGAAVSVTMFRPSTTQAVLVVAADDVAAVETTLRPQLGARLCVVRSRISRSALDDVRRDLEGRGSEWNLVTIGERSDEQGQPVIAFTLTMVTPEIAAWAAERPSGLLVPEPCLLPATTAG